MRITPKIAIAAGAVTLGAAGIAGAVTAPEAAEPGLSKAAEQVGVELPASRDAHPGADPSTDASTEVEETEEVEEADDVEEQDAHEDNHGAAVSAVAQTDHGSGREHGEAVSTAARENHGAEAKAGAAERVDDEVEDEGDDD
jgi:hypothetical protein